MPKSKRGQMQVVKTNHALIPGEIVAEAYSLAMDQALGLQKTSLTAVSEWNAQAIELVWSFAPALWDFFGVSVRTATNCAQWARFFATLPLTMTTSQSLQLPGGGLVVCDSTEQAADDLARSMDLAIGAESAAGLEIEDLSVAAVLKGSTDQLPLPMPVRQTETDESAEAAELIISEVA